MSEVIRLEVKDQSQVWIHTEDSVKAELADRLSFMVPGYQHMPKFKAGFWDGKIRLFNQYSYSILVGLIPEVHRFAKECAYRLEFGTGIKDYFVNSGYSESEMDSWLDSISPRDENGEVMILNDHQVDAIHSCASTNRTVTLSPTSSGKSLIIYSLVRWYLEVEQVQGKILIVVPTKMLVNQMGDDICTYSQGDPSVPVTPGVHRIMGGVVKDSSEQIFVSTWQSIYQLPEEWFRKFSVVIVDEVHNAKGPSLQGVMEKCKDVRFRHGFTGTLDGSNVNELVIKAAFGPIRNFVTTSELMEKGFVAKLSITNVLLRYPAVDRNIVRVMDYQKEVDHIIGHRLRNKKITNLITEMEGNVLVLFTKKDHGAILEKTLSQIPGKRVFMRHGDHNMSEREEVKKIMEESDDVVLVASYGIFSTGVSIKNIRHVMLAAPTKSRIRTLQTIGRGLRVRHDKDSVQLWDVVDEICELSKAGKPKRQNFLMRHFMERVKIYDSERFEYKTKAFSLEDFQG